MFVNLAPVTRFRSKRGGETRAHAAPQTDGPSARVVPERERSRASPMRGNTWRSSRAMGAAVLDHVRTYV